MPVGFEYNGQLYDNPDTMPVYVRRAYENLMEFLGENVHSPDREIIPFPFAAQSSTSGKKKIEIPIAGHLNHPQSSEGRGFLERYQKLFGEPGDQDIADLFTFLNQPPAPYKSPAIIEAPQAPLSRNGPSPDEPVYTRGRQRSHRIAQSKMFSRAVLSLLVALSIFSVGVAAWLVLFSHY